MLPIYPPPYTKKLHKFEEKEFAPTSTDSSDLNAGRQSDVDRPTRRLVLFKRRVGKINLTSNTKGSYQVVVFLLSFFN